MSGCVKDAVAEKLEDAGFWRRAAARWLVVMQKRCTDDELEWLCQRRRYCYSRITAPAPCKIDFRAINHAASQTLKQMGLEQQKGVAFRIKV